MVLATDSVSVAELRSSRRALRAERARVRHWRRLVCARLDLAVSAAAPPEALGIDPALLLDGVMPTLPPTHDELARALPMTLPITEISHLDRLRELDEHLASYQCDLDDLLAATTERYIAHLTVDPLAALDGLRSARGPR
jgi:hypothetical protein